MNPAIEEDGWSIRWLARVGLATKGLVYALMGLLALLAAAGQRSGQIGDKRRSLNTLQALPGGRVVLGLIAIGLLAYALLRISQGLFDTEHKGRVGMGLLRRFGFVVNGFVYAGLIGYAAHGALSGRHGETGRETARSWGALILRWPGGPWLMMLVGAVTVGAGGYALYQAITSRFLDAIDLDSVGEGPRLIIRRTGQIGYCARGIVMVILGSFFVHAGMTARASDVGSAEDALNMLAKMGPIVLGTVAAGLVTYGLYALIQARYPLRHR